MRVRPAGRSSSLQKTIDKAVGIPFLFFVGSLRIKKKKPEKIDHLALLKASAIGDTILLTGAILSLKKKYPQSHVTLFVGKSNVAIAKLIKEVDCVVEIPVTSPLKAIRRIRQFRFDVWLDFGPWTRLEAIFSFFSRAQYKIGFSADGQFRHYAQDAIVIHSRQMHESQNYFHLLSPLGSFEYQLPHLQIPEVTKPELIPPIPFVVFHMWGGGTQAEKRTWPENNWAELAESLSDRYQILLSGGSQDHPRNESLIRLIKNKTASGSKIPVKNIAGINLTETAQVLQHAKVVISIDTGILHMCSALDLPTLGLHGGSHSDRWGVIGKNARSINVYEAHEVPVHFGWEEISGNPMAKITVSQVLSRLKEMGV